MSQSMWEKSYKRLRDDLISDAEERKDGYVDWEGKRYWAEKDVCTMKLASYIQSLERLLDAESWDDDHIYVRDKKRLKQERKFVNLLFAKMLGEEVSADDWLDDDKVTVEME